MKKCRHIGQNKLLLQYYALNRLIIKIVHLIQFCKVNKFTEPNLCLSRKLTAIYATAPKTTTNCFCKTRYILLFYRNLFKLVVNDTSEPQVPDLVLFYPPHLEGIPALGTHQHNFNWTLLILFKTIFRPCCLFRSQSYKINLFLK